MRFAERVARLPRLGSRRLHGVRRRRRRRARSTCSRSAHAHPAYARFLEIGVETAKGLDRHAARLGRARPADDVPLPRRQPRRAGGLRRRVARRGARHRRDAASGVALRRRRHVAPRTPRARPHAAPAADPDARRGRRDWPTASSGSARRPGYEVLPENPPGQVYLGDLHLLDFFARVARARRHRHAARLRAPRDLPAPARPRAARPALDGFPLERVVEMHVAGGSERTTDGFAWVEDDHTPASSPTRGRSSSTSCRARRTCAPSSSSASATRSRRASPASPASRRCVGA